MSVFYVQYVYVHKNIKRVVGLEGFAKRLGHLERRVTVRMKVMHTLSKL